MSIKRRISKMKIVKCNECGAVFEMVVEPKGGQLPEGFHEVKAGSIDGALEKHVPVVEQSGHKLIVKVGSVPHPMLDEHYITAVWVEFEVGTVEKKTLNPGQEPQVHFCAKHRSGKVTVYEYCNLHGLWKTEFTISEE